MKWVYETLLAEPFRLSPSEVGELTDWQAWELFIYPEFRRQQPKGRRRRKNPRLPTREEFVATGMHVGLPRDQCEREYDAWAASEEGKRLAAKPPE